MYNEEGLIDRYKNMEFDKLISVYNENLAHFGNHHPITLICYDAILDRITDGDFENGFYGDQRKRQRYFIRGGFIQRDPDMWL